MTDQYTAKTALQDGIHALAPRQNMTAPARKLRDTYAFVSNAPLYHCEELGYFSLDRWREQGMPDRAGQALPDRAGQALPDRAGQALPEDIEREKLFSLDAGGYFYLIRKGYEPPFEVKVLEDQGAYELVQDNAGRHVLFFKGRRNGFMPEYQSFPVTDRRTWEEQVKWRLDPATPSRYDLVPEQIAKAKAAAAQGVMIRAYCAGYAFLRNMVGTINVLYAFYDMPDVVHEIMAAWLRFSDAALARYQEHVTLDELFFGEDICYKTAPFISERMFREFFLPYYQQLVNNVRARQIDHSRKLFVHVDSDGRVAQVIPWYREMGMNVMSPFEVAAENDMLALSRQYPDLVMWGGIDKRVLAQSTAAIDEMLERIIPAMRARGGYVPCCDHGVPEEVPYTNYLHYRRRCLELGD